MSKDLQNLVCITLVILLVGVAGCGKEKKDVSPLALGPQIPKKGNFKGVDFIDRKNGISFRYYPEYRETHRDERGAILSKENKKERIVLVVWPFDLDTYMWYVDAFANPLTLKKRLQKELKVKEEAISYRVLEKEGAEAFLFTTRLPAGGYIQRLELFPKAQPLQISLFFWHEKENDPLVLDMIASIKILSRDKGGGMRDE